MYRLSLFVDCLRTMYITPCISKFFFFFSGVGSPTVWILLLDRSWLPFLLSNFVENPVSFKELGSDHFQLHVFDDSLSEDKDNGSNVGDNEEDEEESDS